MLHSVNILKENIQDGSKVAENESFQSMSLLVDEILSGCWNLIDNGGKAKIVHDPDPKTIHYAYLRKNEKEDTDEKTSEKKKKEILSL